MTSEPNQKITLLGVFAHPHDFTHAAGTCAHHVKRGDRVAIVILTDGSTMHNERLYDERRKPPAQQDPKIISQSQEHYAAQKARELRQVCELFGVTDVRILPNPDTFIRRSDEMIHQLVDWICDLRPDILITQRPQHESRHRIREPDDHFICARIVHEALAVAAQAAPGRDRAPHEVAQVYYIGVGSGWEQIDLFVDITDQYEKRIEAERMFGTQNLAPSKANRKIEIGAGFYGWHTRVPYAEPFIRANSELSRYLTLTEESRSQARESHVQREKRIARTGR